MPIWHKRGTSGSPGLSVVLMSLSFDYLHEIEKFTFHPGIVLAQRCRRFHFWELRRGARKIKISLASTMNWGLRTRG